VQKHEKIIDVGCGESTLIGSLIQEGYQNLVATDICEKASTESKRLLGTNSARVKWIVDDVTNALPLSELSDVTLWHDRAVLHFLLEDAQRLAYLKLLNKVLRINGYVIIATFSLKGAKKCSGLDVRNYDQILLAEFLGSNYQLLKYIDHDYTQPSRNLRPFIYTLFQRTG
jgi:2-polyprenyl-3-methyl-5-hydroxy-6-metoxy-1,4-benzoquinol methylase